MHGHYNLMKLFIMAPGSAYPAISDAMTSSSTAVQGRHMQSAGAFVTNCKRKTPKISMSFLKTTDRDQEGRVKSICSDQKVHFQFVRFNLDNNLISQISSTKIRFLNIIFKYCIH